MWVFKILTVLALCDQILSAPSESDDQDDMMQLDTNSTEEDHDLEGMKEDEDYMTLDTAADPDMNYDYGEIMGNDEADGAEMDDDDDKGDDETGETQLLFRSPSLRGPVIATRRIAFTVKRARASVRTAPSTLRFTNVVLNNGNALNGNRGTFVAPTRALYYFSFNAIAATDEGFTLALRVNGRTRFTAHATRQSREHASSSGVLRLSKRDRVNLRLLRGSIFEPTGNDAYTTFSGFVLYLTPFF